MQFRLSATPTVPCGIWQDGAPCNWDRSVTAGIVSLLLTGLEERCKNLRSAGLSRISQPNRGRRADTMERHSGRATGGGPNSTARGGDSLSG
eukprot:6636545-Pyramimonas_sp.AAC.1